MKLNYVANHLYIISLDYGFHTNVYNFIMSNDLCTKKSQ